MTRITQTISLVGVLVILIALSERGIQAQELPEILVEVRFEGDNYLTSPDIDINRLANDLTVVTSEILHQVSEFGFISFRPRDSGDTLNLLPLAEFLFYEKKPGPNTHEHRLSMIWHPTDSSLGAVMVFDELIFGSVDEHHRDDEDNLRLILSDRLGQILKDERFTEPMMNKSFAMITLAESLAPRNDRLVNIPISQTLMHADPETRFQAWFIDSTNFSNSGFLTMKVVLPAAMSLDPGRTLCHTEAFQIPIGSDVAAEDLDARWPEIVDILSDTDELRVLVRMLKYVPEGSPSVIAAGGPQ